MSDRVTDYWAIDRLGFGPHDGRQTSARSLALIDTTIPRRFKQLAMVPMLVLIARTASAGSEATR